jgi:predicted HTH transcriptional regulator
VVRVPPAPRRVRPIFTKGNPYNGTYVHRNEGDYPATRPEVDRMMREASDLAADQVILDGYTWDDLDRSTFSGYRRRFQTAQPDSPHVALDDDAFLSAVGGYLRERETNRSGITVAGLLMFGTDEAIRSWRGRYLIDFRVVAGDPTTQVLTQWDDRLPWEGNLLGAFDAIYRRLIDGLPVPFAVVDGVRVDQTPQHVAIREAFVNLLLHADYSEQAASLVIRSGDGYYFRNPGSSRVPDLDPAFGNRSDPRNPALVRMFRLIGLAEEARSGVPRIVQAWRGLGYESPSFDLGWGRHEFSVHLKFAHLLSDVDREWLEALGLPLTEDEQLALVMARRDGYVDNASLRQVTGRHLVDVTRVLGGLRDRELLRMIGAKRGARYELGEAVELASVPPSMRDLGTPSMGDYSQSIGDLPASSGDLGTPSTGDSDELTTQRLEALAAPIARSGRLDARVRDEIIVRMCELRPMSITDLSDLLHRHPDYVRHILNDLVVQGKLRHQYPDRPRHPNQRYRAIDTFQRAKPSPAKETVVPVDDDGATR